jgi:cytochrome c553
LLKALRDYKNNTRRAYDAAMADVMHPLTEANLQELSHYLSRLR